MARVLFILGPTASGKSRLALELARQEDGEIVSADSMQVYRGMDIGTAKPTAAERRKVRHHLIDICRPSRLFSVADFYTRAVKAIRDIQSRNRLPIVVGGSGLYIRSLLQGLESTPASDPVLRKKIEKQCRSQGREFIWNKLKKLAPETARRVDPLNERRVTRALEIAILSARKSEKIRVRFPPLAEIGVETLVIGLNPKRENLYLKINERIDQMFRGGWLREARLLTRQRIARTARQALGYRHLWNWMKDGANKKNLAAVKDAIKRDTRHFAKRQWTWFRREKNVRWIDFDTDRSLQSCVSQIRNGLNSSLKGT